MVSAETNSTDENMLPKMFIPAKIPSNAYNDTFHNFSIVPPEGWIIKSESNETENLLVEFSNENLASLAHFDIYYNKVNPIPPSMFSLPDDQILNSVIAKLFDPSQIHILQKNIQRFSDGFVIQAVFTQTQNTQTSPNSEMLIFWLADGRQYFLSLTSSQNNFNQNEAEFERSAYTFYVFPEKVPAVPEFGPISILVFLVMLSAVIVLMKTTKLT